jgi:hypothetical protein
MARDDEDNPEHDRFGDPHLEVLSSECELASAPGKRGNGRAWSVVAHRGAPRAAGRSERARSLGN